MSLLALKSFGSVPIGGNGVISVIETTGNTVDGNASYTGLFDGAIQSLGGRLIYKLDKDSLAPRITARWIGASNAPGFQTTINADSAGDQLCSADGMLGKRSILGGAPTGCYKYLFGSQINFYPQVVRRLSSGKIIALCKLSTSAGTENFLLICLNADMTVYWSRQMSAAYYRFNQSNFALLEAPNGDIIVSGTAAPDGAWYKPIIYVFNYVGSLSRSIVPTHGTTTSNTYSYLSAITPNGKLQISVIGANAQGTVFCQGYIINHLTGAVESTYPIGLYEGLNPQHRSVVYGADGNYYAYSSTSNGNYLAKHNGTTHAVIWCKKIMFNNIANYDVGLMIDGDFLYFNMYAYTNKWAFFKIPLSTGIPAGVYDTINGFGTTLTVTDIVPVTGTVTGYFLGVNSTITDRTAVMIRTAVSTTYAGTKPTVSQAQHNL